MNEVRNCNQSGYAVSCQFSVPAAVTCFFEGETYEECMKMPRALSTTLIQ